MNCKDSLQQQQQQKPWGMRKDADKLLWKIDIEIPTHKEKVFTADKMRKSCTFVGPHPAPNMRVVEKKPQYSFE